MMGARGRPLAITMFDGDGRDALVEQVAHILLSLLNLERAQRSIKDGILRMIG
jgi:hypothetical protein